MQDGTSITLSERKATHGKGPLLRHFRLTRTAAHTIAIQHLDFTGAQYEFSLNITDGKATLVRPCLAANEEGELLIRVLWKALLETQALTFGLAVCRG
jgi:hypothetical protein